MSPNLPLIENDIIEKVLDSEMSAKQSLKAGEKNGNGVKDYYKAGDINKLPKEGASAISFREINEGLSMKRMHTKPDKSVYEQINYAYRNSTIREPDGTIVFEMKNVEVPEQFSQLATDILVSKYFRKAGLISKERDSHIDHETSIKQVVHRIVHTISQEGEKRGYFTDKESAKIFEEELAFILLTQRGAFNSPVWFNTGLWHEYGIRGSGGNWVHDLKTGQNTETADAYSQPQLSACFIQSVKDDLMSIFDLAKNEAKLFKYGSGTGTNFSNVRSRYEKLSGGGTSSGLMSFLEVLDKGAGATKSGGTTRRAAKMVILEMDHPEIEDFIEWKVKEENKADALMKMGYEAGFEGEAYRSVSGQNSNNSVRITDEFMQAVLDDKEWQTRFRTTGEAHKTMRARSLFDKVCEAAWKVADPGVQFDTTINRWHTCKASGRINGSNPCSEFMFIDDSACNLASINLMKYLNEDGTFKVEEFLHAVRLFIIAQEIIVAFASYPTPAIAENSVKFRPLGLGYANLGTWLMTKGIPYDSEAAYATSAAITALMTGESYKVSAEMAAKIGPFAAFSENRSSMLEVMDLHISELNKIDSTLVPSEILKSAQKSWKKARELGGKFGYRNSQVTLLAPTGTIGLLMDCDTTGVEPDYSLVKYKKLSGGGYFKIINNSIPQALTNLGYNQKQVDEIIAYVLGHGSLKGAPYYNCNQKTTSGLCLTELFSSEDLDKAENSIQSTQNLDGYTQAINPRVLKEQGFSNAEIKSILIYVNGAQTVEGAPHLKKEHYAVFDCANRCGIGERYIAPMGHVKMMAAVQPFLSGAISKTVNLPNHATVSDVYDIYMEAWKRGVKSIALYRDGSKLAQPLTTNDDNSENKEEKVEKTVKAGEVKKEANPVKLNNLKEIPIISPDSLEISLTPAQKGNFLGERGVRRSLPIKRTGFTLESSVSGHKVFLRTGEYEDGALGEIFIDMYKEGASYRSLLNCFAISVSIGLQYGVPLEKFVNAFTFTRFEPNGMTDHPFVRSATSILDFIFRILGFEYLNRTDFLQVKPNSMDDLNGSPAKEENNSLLESTSDLQANQCLTKKEDKEEEKKIQSKKSASVKKTVEIKVTQNNPLEQQLAELMGDAPQCNICGHLTVRNGTCYKCLNCGNSLGCS